MDSENLIRAKQNLNLPKGLHGNSFLIHVCPDNRLFHPGITTTMADQLIDEVLYIDQSVRQICIIFERVIFSYFEEQLVEILFTIPKVKIFFYCTLSEGLFRVIDQKPVRSLNFGGSSYPPGIPKALSAISLVSLVTLTLVCESIGNKGLKSIMKLNTPCLIDLRLVYTKVTADSIKTLNKHMRPFGWILVNFENYFRSDQLFRALFTLMDFTKKTSYTNVRISLVRTKLGMNFVYLNHLSKIKLKQEQRKQMLLDFYEKKYIYSIEEEMMQSFKANVILVNMINCTYR